MLREYDVYVQATEDDPLERIGQVRAPTAEMALVYAKEDYLRRTRAVRLEVVAEDGSERAELADPDLLVLATSKSYRTPRFFARRRKALLGDLGDGREDDKDVIA